MADEPQAPAPAQDRSGRIRTSGDSEVATYLEIAEAREPGNVLTPAPNAPEAVVVLDYGSQFSMLIARRIREANVYCEMLPWDTPAERLNHLKVKAFVLSGGPASVYEPGAPTLPPYVLGSGVPVLGICYGMQLLAHALGGKVDPAPAREYGHAVMRVAEAAHPLFKDLPADLAVQGDTARRARLRAAHDDAMRIEGLGQCRRSDSARRRIGFGPVEGHAEMGATRATGQTGMTHTGCTDSRDNSERIASCAGATGCLLQPMSKRPAGNRRGF